MRLWSLHPKYLDPQGLVALWREALLAQKVLAGLTKGYKHHPQLVRFRKAQDPLAAIGTYLYFVEREARARDYNFDSSKIIKILTPKTRRLKVTYGQIQYESEHLLKKLEQRNPQTFKKWAKESSFEPHPFFRKGPGGVEAWEKLS